MASASVAITMLLMATSCSDNQADDTGSTRITLTLAVADGRANDTRAANTGWDDYDPSTDGDASESDINTADIQIAVCDASGNVIANIDDIRATRTTQTEYTVTGTWNSPKQLVAQARRIMVTANAHATDISSLPQATFSLGSIGRYIPMWGVTRISTTLTHGKSNDIGTIDLLRAMAKVRVTMRSDMTERGYSISQLTLSRYNTRGYVAPRGFESVDYTRDIMFEGSLNTLPSPADTPELDFTATQTAYVPEYDNTSATAMPATISVSLKRGNTDDGTYTLRFRNYDADGQPTGTPYDIQRNHMYEYVVYKQSDQLTVTLHVRPWNVRQHDDIIM